MDPMHGLHDILRHLREPQSPDSSVSMGDIATALIPADSSSFDQRSDTLFQRFTTLVGSERDLLEQERRKLQKEQEDFEAEKEGEMQRYEQARKEWEEQKSAAESQTNVEGSIFEINVGGQTTVTTTRTTLTKVPNSALAALFSGRHRIPYFHGQVFIDRDPEPFCNMISFLRTGKLPGFKTASEEIEFLEELDYWQIHLDPDSSDENKVITFDPELVAQTLSLEQDNTVIRKKETNNGMAITSLPLTHRDQYVEFLINISDSSHPDSHVFIGVVDRSKYSTSRLQSNKWKEAPSSYFWDVWSSKLIKIDENGTPTTVKGYGCGCQDDECEIGIWYDYKTSSLAFYKDGLCQGTAFTNVPAGLYPSIDVWFEQGTVEIRPTRKPVQKIYM